MEHELLKLISGMQRKTVSSASDENVQSATPIFIDEPADINAAIALYKRRAELLEMVKKNKFDTLHEYTAYKNAQDLIRKHKEKTENAAAQDQTNKDAQTADQASDQTRRSEETSSPQTNQETGEADDC